MTSSIAVTSLGMTSSIAVTSRGLSTIQKPSGAGESLNFFNIELLFYVGLEREDIVKKGNK